MKIKKLLLLCTVLCAAATCLCAFAAEVKRYDSVIVTYFKEDGSLKGCRMSLAAEDGSISLSYDNMQKGEFAKVYTTELTPIDTVYDFTDVWQPALSTPEPTLEPTADPTTEPTAAPTASPQATKEPVPAIYEKEGDAITAFAVVDHAAVEAVGENEIQYAVYVWYQGRERVLYIPEDMRLTASSDACSYANGQAMTYLQCGDVITFTTKMSGKIRDVSLIYRLRENDIVTSEQDFGASFEKLISHNGMVGMQSAAVYRYGSSNESRIQYIFGVITDKTARSFTLSNKAGRAEDAADISILDDTIVYVYDTNRSQLSLGTTGDIIRSDISDRDEDGNILSWSDQDTHHYALARIIDGVATEVVVYQN